MYRRSHIPHGPADVSRALTTTTCILSVSHESHERHSYSARSAMSERAHCVPIISHEFYKRLGILHRVKSLRSSYTGLYSKLQRQVGDE